LDGSASGTAAQTLRLFCDIARFRKGPADAPASVPLLLGLMLVVGLCRLALAHTLPARITVPPVAIASLSVAGTLLLPALFLKLAGHAQRYLPTVTALFGYLMVLAPLLLLTSWLFVAAGDDPLLRWPAAALRFGVELWSLAVAARVLSLATGWPFIACVILSVATELLIFLAISSVFASLPVAP
jgi:hypothetical protein